MTDKKIENRKRLKEKRKKRTRLKVSGTGDRPRLAVSRSARHVYVQVIDDVAQKTIASASSFEKGRHTSANIDGCEAVGKLIAERCAEKNITKVVFDKCGNKYHGRIKAVAEGARAGGIQF